MEFVDVYFKFIKTHVGKGVILILVSFLAFYREEMKVLHVILGLYLFLVGVMMLVFSCWLYKD